MGAGSKRFPGNDTPACTRLQTWLGLPYWPELFLQSKAQKYKQIEKLLFFASVMPQVWTLGRGRPLVLEVAVGRWLQEPPQPPREAPRVSHLSVHNFLS